MDTIKKSEVLAELIKSHGVVTVACNNAGISRSSFYNCLNSDAEFKAAVDDINEVAIDFVESALFNLIKNADTAATLFYLKTKGKKRGYQERTEVTGADGKELIPKILIEIIGGTQDKSE